MKKKQISDILLIAIFVAAAIVLAYSLTIMSKTSGQKTVAEVNGHRITESDLQEVMLTIPVQYRSNLTNETLIEQAVNLEIITEEASKLGITVTDQEVENSIENTLASAGIPREDFIKAVNDQGISEDTLKSAYKKQLLSLKFVNETILKKINITEKETRDAYDAYSSQLNMTYEVARPQIERALLVQKGQIALQLFLEQKIKEYNITRAAQ